jgi:hypothetical protein
MILLSDLFECEPAADAALAFDLDAEWRQPSIGLVGHYCDNVCAVWAAVPSIGVDHIHNVAAADAGRPGALHDVEDAALQWRQDDSNLIG